MKMPKKANKLKKTNELKIAYKRFLKQIKFFPLQKIKIISSTKACKAHSEGYVSYTVPSYTVIHPINIYFVKYGQKGKPRINYHELHYSAIDYEWFETMYRDIINNFLKQSQFSITAEISPTTIETKNIINMSTEEFLCYASAFGNYMAYMESMFLKLQCLPIKRSISIHFIQDQPMHKIDIIDIGTIVKRINYVNAHIKDRNIMQEFIDHYKNTLNRCTLMETAQKTLVNYNKIISIYHKKLDESFTISKDNLWNNMLYKV